MTVMISIGRRIPRSWFKRQARRAIGFMSFQENLWIIIKQSLSMAKRKANNSNTGISFVMTNDREIEDINYEIEWIKIIIQGTEAQEQEEYDESMKMYQTFGKIFKKEMPVNDDMKKHFKSKILSSIKVDEAYKKGYGSITDNNIANKMLEMGILTHIEWNKDFDMREQVYPTS